jgi:cold shock CspA family protein
MVQVTPLLDSMVHGQLQELLALETPVARRQAIRLFLEYLLHEDRRYCVTPDHDAYAAQAEIARAFTRAIVGITRSPIRISESPRFGRPSGFVVSWKPDDGYGFISSSVVPTDIFVHISEVESRQNDYLEVGTEVAFDIHKSEKGLQAVNVAIINVPPGQQFARGAQPLTRSQCRWPR